MSKRNAVRWTAGAGAAALAAVAAWWAFHYAEFRHHWGEARRALEAQDADRARVHLARCLAWYGGASLDVHLLTAQAARLAGDYEAAEEHLALCEGQSGLPTADVKRERALLQVQQGDFRGHLEYLQGNLETRALPPDAQEGLARGLAGVLFFSEAAACGQRLLAEDPDHPRAHMLAGNIMLHNRFPGQAVHEFEAVVRQLPGAFTPRLRLAECLVELGDLREAATHLQVLQDGCPDTTELQLLQARVAIYRAQPQKAREILRRLLAARPDHVDALVALGQLEFRQGDPRHALPWLQSAVAVHPGKAEAWETLARCHAVLGEPDEEKRCLAEFDRVGRALGEITRLIIRVMQERVNDIDLRVELAERYERLHESDKAIQWRICVLHVDPAHAPTHRALARLFEQTGQPHRAARHRALAEKKDQP